jgi:hypothetical protein
VTKRARFILRRKNTSEKQERRHWLARRRVEKEEMSIRESVLIFCFDFVLFQCASRTIWFAALGK